MTALAKRSHTEGDHRQYFVDYSNVMRNGDWISGASVSVNKVSVTVTTPVIHDPSHISFFANGGVVNEDFTVTVTVTLNDTEVFHDTIDFHVVDP